MPRPKCRVIGCPQAATEFPPLTSPGETPNSDDGDVLALCIVHYAQHKDGGLDMNRIGMAVTVD